MMDIDVSKEELLRSKFSQINQRVDDPAVISKFLALSYQHSLNLDALMLKWEAFTFNNSTAKDPTLQNVEKFQKSLQSQSQFSVKKNDVMKQTTFNKDSINQIVNMLGVYDEFKPEDIQKQFEKKRPRPNDDEPPNNSDDEHDVKACPSSFESKTSLSGKVEASYNTHLSQNPELVERAEINVIQQPKSFKAMNNPLRLKATVLEERIETLGAAIVQKAQLQNIIAVNAPSQEQVSGYGMITCEVDGKLNDVSVVLQSSLPYGQQRVRMSLRDCQEFSIFPGQVVAVEGSNPTGKLFIVKHVHQGSRLPLYVPQEPLPTEGVSMLIACGPFTSHKDMSFKGLRRVLEEAISRDVSVLILIGPLIDVEHPLIAESQEPFENLSKRLLKQINDEFEGCVLFVPSTRDLTHLPTFPQAPIKKEPEDPIEHVGNPAFLDISGIGLGVTSQDVIKELSAEESSRNIRDRIPKLCSHLLQQRSFYPIFPPTAACPLDFRGEKDLQLPSSPHLLIVPSDLKCFIHEIDGTVAINPGRAIKGDSLGTFGVLTVHPPSEATSEVHKRTRAEIIHL